MPYYVPKCPGPICKHRFHPDSNVLYGIVCSDCGASQSLHTSKDQPLYLKYRRSLRHQANLVNISARLDCRSAQTLEEISFQCGIAKIATLPHSITLVEGLLPHAVAQDTLEELKYALANCRSLKIRKLHKVRQSRKNSDLIIADVDINSMEVRAVLHRISQSCNCVLPQFPIHVALGSVTRVNEKSADALRMARAKMKGLVLGVDHTRMKVASTRSQRMVKEEHVYGEVAVTYRKQSPGRAEGLSVVTHVTEEATTSSEEEELLDLPPGFDLTFLDFEEEEHGGDESNKECLNFQSEPMLMPLRELAAYIDVRNAANGRRGRGSA